MFILNWVKVGQLFQKLKWGPERRTLGVVGDFKNVLAIFKKKKKID
jgi:hypothetical protein